MSKVFWSDAARADMREIISYIAADNPYAAKRLAEKVRAVGDNLADRATGRIGRIESTYEKVVQGTPYILAYMLKQADKRETIVILRVIHMARDWQSDEWPE